MGGGLRQADGRITNPRFEKSLTLMDPSYINLLDTVSYLALPIVEGGRSPSFMEIVNFPVKGTFDAAKPPRMVRIMQMRKLLV